MQKLVSREFNLANLKEITELVPSSFDYFVFYGTLLGFHREKNIIKDDGDIDFYIDTKHRKDLIEIIKYSNFEIKINNQDILQATKKFDKTQTYVDFYFYQNQDKNDYIYEAWTSKLKKVNLKVHIPKKYIFPIITSSLKNISVRIPNNTEACCRFIYGENFMIPSQKYTIYESLKNNNKSQ